MISTLPCSVFELVIWWVRTSSIPRMVTLSFLNHAIALLEFILDRPYKLTHAEKFEQHFKQVLEDREFVITKVFGGSDPTRTLGSAGKGGLREDLKIFWYIIIVVMIGAIHSSHK